MDLTSKQAIKELLLQHSASPSKLMGQHFLSQKTILEKIIEAADLTANDIVVEVGPGIGTLTQALAQKAKKVVAAEKDSSMTAILQETLKEHKNVEVILGDALTYPLPTTDYKVVANIPYYLTAHLIRRFLEAEHQPTLMVLMIQKEVARRICSKPPNMSLLAVSVQFYAKASIVATVSKKCFWPSPKVDSAIIKMVPQSGKPSVPAETFFKVAKAGFLHPRKQLANNLAEGLKVPKEQITPWLLQNNIKPTQRAETLSLEDWITLSKNFNP